MRESFGPELSIMGETVAIGNKTARAVVDAITVSQGIDGALIETTVGFDVYILKEDAERIGVDHRVKIVLSDKGGVSGRVTSIMPIDGGQLRVRLTNDSNN